MPYRGEEEFYWHTADPRVNRTRAIAAVVLVAAGWAVGFFSGRMSAWVFPVEPTGTVAVTAPAPNPQPASGTETAAQPPPQAVSRALDAGPAQTEPGSAKGADKHDPSRLSAAPAAPEAADTASAAAGEGSTATAPAGNDGASARQPGPAEAGVVLINPQWPHARNDPGEAEPGGRRRPERAAARVDDGGAGSGTTERNDPALESALRACERRYNSFRRSDGTYQPYGRSARVPCPLLR
jgi:hypothetical protein